MKEQVPSSSFYRPPRPDEFIRQEILWGLSRSGIMDPGEIEVSVEAGVVKIRGSVFTRQQKRRIGECVAEISGVRHVENQVKISRVARFRDGHSMHGF